MSKFMTVCEMTTVSTRCKDYDNSIWEEYENKYNIKIKSSVKSVLKANNGGYPKNDIIVIKGKEYEVRYFLSTNKSDHNYIGKSLDYFLRKKDKYVPVAEDSGSNYYCISNDNGKLYYWKHEDDEFTYLTSVSEFLKALG